MWSRRLGPRIRFATFGGLSPNQLMLLAIGAFATLEVLSQGSQSWWGLPAGIASAIWFGRAVLRQKWGMPKADWMMKRLAFRTDRRKIWEARAVGREAEQLPRELADVALVPVRLRDRGGVAGAFRERRTLTMAAPVDLHSLGLFDPAERGRRLDAFRRILDALARDADDLEFRFSITSRKVPRVANAARQHIVQNVVVDPSSPQVASMLEVVDDSVAVSSECDFVVAVRRSISPEEGESGRLIDQAAMGLVGRMRGLLDRLERADIAVRTSRDMFSPPELARWVKDSFDPFGQSVRDRLEAASGLPGSEPTRFGPDGVRRHEDCLQSDSAWSATMWMRGYPEEEVGPGWITPLSLDCDVEALALTTVFAPVKKAEALKQIKRKRNRTRSLRVEKRRHGKEDEEEHTDRAEFLDRQAHEIVNLGASAWRSETYATVSARSRDELGDLEHGAIKTVAEAAADCGLTAVWLRFTPGYAHTFTLPLCRGLRPERPRL
jgi:hypothetical protein